MNPPVNAPQRILVSAYACEPGKGSEPEIGWRWALGLAERGHEIWVLTRANNRISIENALGSDCPPNLHFVHFDLPSWGLWVKRLLGTNIYYHLWQVGARSTAERLHRRHTFDRAHHVTFGAIRHPSFLRHLGVPYVLGPVAGGEDIPRDLLRCLPLSVRLAERYRTLATRLLLLLPTVRQTLVRADRVVVTSEQTRRLLPQRVRPRSDVRLAITTPVINGVPAIPRLAPTRGLLRVLFVGRLLPWKGVELALRSLAAFAASGHAFKFTVVGAGPHARSLRQMSSALGLAERVEFRPWVARNELPEVYDEHDVLLFPSMRDSGGMVVLEAMQRGLPVVCLHLGGPGVIVTPECGWAVEPGDVDVTIARIAGALQALATDPAHYRACSAAAQRRVADFAESRLLAALGY